MARGWSQETLAAELAKVGLNVGGQSGAARIERGVRPTRFNEVVAIADFLDIDLKDLGVGVSPSAVANVAAEISRVRGEVDKLSAALKSAEDAANTAEHHATTIRLRHASASTRLKFLEGRLQ